MSMNNLANSYSAAGRTQEAFKLREETLQLRKAKLGPDHPDTLMSMSNLAVSYSELGRLDEALKLFEETLALRKAKLGPNHPAMIGSIYNFACTHSLMIAKADDKTKQANTAMDWLKRAVTAGFKNVEHMKTDKDLDPLREREDFKKLIAELEAKAKETPPKP
jgi:tetratricopeptide (TPR) repeat protein